MKGENASEFVTRVETNLNDIIGGSYRASSMGVIADVGLSHSMIFGNKHSILIAIKHSILIAILVLSIQFWQQLFIHH